MSNLARLSLRWQIVTLVLSLLFVLLTASLLAPLPVSQIMFGLVCLMFVAYSLPPLRLKARGWMGAVCIALGEHVLPALLSLFLVVETCGCRPSLLWLIALVGWSACFGLRGIIWHQLSDLENDLKAGCATMAVEMQTQALNKIARGIIFPIECICLLVLLSLLGNVWAWVALGLYAFLDYSRWRFMSANIIVVSPRPCARFVLFEYYQLLWPVSILLSAISADKAAVFLIAGFCFLFSVPLALSVLHIFHMARHNWGSGIAPLLCCGSYFAVAISRSSRCLIAGIIFAFIFFVLPRLTVERDRVDYLVRVNGPEQMAPRIEQYLVSSKNADIVILGSSTVMVPNILCDSATHPPKSFNSVTLAKRPYTNIEPQYFTDLLRRTQKNISVVNLGFPAADIEDHLQVLKNALRFGKNPKQVLLGIGIRDFAVHPWLGRTVSVSPLALSLGDIALPSSFHSSCLARWFFVYLRRQKLESLLQGELFYWRSAVSKLARPLGILINKALPDDLALPLYSELGVSGGAKVSTPVNPPFKVASKYMSDLLTQTDSDKAFVSRQFKALKVMAEMLSLRGITLVIWETPLCPSVHCPPVLMAKYRQEIEALVKEGKCVYCPAPALPDAEYVDPIHLNLAGSYKLLDNLAAYLARYGKP